MLRNPTLRKQVVPNPDKMSIIQELIQTAYPTSLRLSGMLNDAYQIDHQDYIPLEEIRVPTMVIHGTADDVVPFEQESTVRPASPVQSSCRCMKAPTTACSPTWKSPDRRSWNFWKNTLQNKISRFHLQYDPYR